MVGQSALALSRVCDALSLDVTQLLVADVAQEAPTPHPRDGALRFILRDGGRLHDDQSAGAQVVHGELRDPGLISVTIDEVLQVLPLVNGDAARRFANGSGERLIRRGINIRRSDLGAMI